MSRETDAGRGDPVLDLDLSPERRAAVVRELCDALSGACPGARGEPRGSLAAGTADPYSDIDLLWDVPDERFAGCLAEVGDVLGRVRPVSAVRVDPDYRLCDRRRLLFVHFADLPLFWRLDLDVRARSVAGDETYGSDAVAAPGDDWSAAASALANAVAAIKAVRRGRHGDARGLLERGLARVDALEALDALDAPGVGAAVSGDWRRDVTRLASAAADAEPAQADHAARVTALARALLGP
jgi:hypothetical protein